MKNTPLFQAWKAAVEHHAGKKAMGSFLDTEGWRAVPVALRERAFFSATVEEARFTSEMKQEVQDWLSHARDPQTGALKSGGRADFVAKMRSRAEAWGYGYENGNDDLTNLQATRRLELIFDHNVATAQGYADHLAGMDADVLDNFPCQELIRIRNSEEPRDWESRWSAAGGQLYGGRMIARKDSSIWTAISRFGTPYPPFDFNSGMGIEDVSREEAEALGVMQPGDVVDIPTMKGYNEDMSVSVAGMDDEVRRLMAQAMPNASLQGDRLVMGGSETAQPPTVPQFKPAPLSATVKPVSDAVKLKTKVAPVKDALNTALDAIKDVHSDGVLPEIPVKSRKSKSNLGAYTYGRKKDVDITINPSGKWSGLTAAHEIGHFIHNRALGGIDQVSQDMKAVIDAAKQSKAITEIQSELAKATFTQQKKYLKYLLTDKEVWARTYSQYIAVRSGNKKLLEQLDVCRKENKRSQWQDDDFEPIAEAIDSFFEKLGWRTKQ